MNVNVKFGQARLTSQYSDAAPFEKDIASEAEDNPTDKRYREAGRTAPQDWEKKDSGHCGRNDNTAFSRVGLDERPNAEQESEPDAYGLVWNAQEKTQMKKGKEKVVAGVGFEPTTSGL